MDTSKLHKGQIIKNHKALCELLGVEPKTNGKSKQLQWKAFENHFKFHKQGHSIIIDEVYVKPKVVTGRMTTSKLIRYGVEYNILRVMLSNIKQSDVTNLNCGVEDLDDLQTYYFTSPTLHKAVGLVGDVYYTSRHHQEEIAEIEDIPLAHVQDFFNCTHKRIDTYLKQSLQELHDKRLLTYGETKKITLRYESSQQTSVNDILDNKRVQVGCVYNDIYATHEQLAFINKCERKVMVKFKLKKFNQIYTRSKNTRERFFSQCYKEVRKQAKLSQDPHINVLKDLHKYAKCYKMTFVPNWIEEELQRVGKELSYNKSSFLELLNEHTFEEIQHLPTNVEDMRDYVNDTNMKSLKGNISNRNMKANSNSFRSDKDYVANGTILVDNYINRSCDDTKEKLIEHGLMKAKKDYSRFDDENIVTYELIDSDTNHQFMQMQQFMEEQGLSFEDLMEFMRNNS